MIYVCARVGTAARRKTLSVLTRPRKGKVSGTKGLLPLGARRLSDDNCSLRGQKHKTTLSGAPAERPDDVPGWGALASVIIIIIIVINVYYYLLLQIL